MIYPGSKTIIDAFERCFCGDNKGCPGCYKGGPGFGFECRKSLCMDVLVLLKTTYFETVPIETDDGRICCDACGYEIKRYSVACPHCGRIINWEK